jgi:protein tyrosine phosphatase
MNDAKDFWRMVWEQGVETIVMVTGLVESGKVKCERYWPTHLKWKAIPAPEQNTSESMHIYGPYFVSLLEETENQELSFVTTRLRISNGAEESRDIVHFWMTAWLDKDVPNSTKDFLGFISRLHGRTESYSPPVVVHCSAGVGRTGTLMATHIAMQEYKETKSCDILKTVCNLRQDRGGLVQSFV